MSAHTGLFLAVASLAFLFAGLFKGQIWNPGDWTIFLGAVVAGNVAVAGRRELDELLQSRAVWTFLLLVGYLAFRLPALWPPDFGHYKLGVATVFGLPAFAAGFILMRQWPTILTWALEIAGTIVAIAVIVAWLRAGAPHWAQDHIGGGYQLQSYLLGLGLIAATEQVLRGRRWAAHGVVAVISFLGAAVAGGMAGFYFAAAIAAVLGVMARVSRAKLIGVMVAAVGSVALLSAAAGPPPSIARVAWKGEIVKRVITTNDRNEESRADETAHMKQDLTVPQKMDRESIAPATKSRLTIMRRALDDFLSAPFLGIGWGTFRLDKQRTEHNIVLEMMVESGIIGTIVLLAFLGIAVMPAVSAFARNDPAAMTALGASLFMLSVYMVSSFFMGRIFMFALGMAYAMRHTEGRAKL